MEGVMAESEKTPRRPAKRSRCAIYTRKSSDEGLEQAFNSLDAQREACTAFILSQKHEGWTVLPTLYDDGGFSGGTMERPALKRLIADIEARQIDVVVVYKVDRLTRALSDFAKLVEVFDRRGVSFVQKLLSIRRRPHMTLSGPYSANKDDEDDHSHPTWGKENMSRLSNR
jgi:site-specific DNA recombinase